MSRWAAVPVVSRPAWGQAGRATRGQALVIVALMFVVLLGFVGLAIDVSSAYAARRFERSVADAAALAGAQDLQTLASEAVTPAQQVAAREHALQSVKNQLGASGTGGTCDPNANIVDCVLTPGPYHVSISTPATTCLSNPSGCDSHPLHSVQVSIHNPGFETAFARLFGSRTWDVGITSVAGLSFATKYAVITLQPPKIKNNQTDANLCQNLVVDGNGTVLNVVTGDIGTNTSAATTNQGLIRLNNGNYASNTYYIEHLDILDTASCGVNTNPTWSVDAHGNPPGLPIGELINDPSYMYAQLPLSGGNAAPTFQDQDDPAAQVPCTDPSVNYPSDELTQQFLTAPEGGVTTCYRPGIYEKPFTVANKNVAYLAPGAYKFLGGLTVNSVLAGGLVNTATGVVLVFPQSKAFNANNSSAVVVLNTGGRACDADGCRASPAVDFTGAPVQTPQGLVLTVEVERAPAPNACFVGTTPSNADCKPQLNTSVKLTAAELVQIAGVIYGPSDNMSITGGSEQEGLVGQIVSWTVMYTGQSILNQSYPGNVGMGVLRLDRACSGGGAPCVE